MNVSCKMFRNGNRDALVIRMAFRSCVLVASVSMCMLPWSRAAAQTRERTVDGQPLERVFEVGSLNDRTLINPIRIAADDSLILAFDDADRALKAFSLQGTLLWSFGREGAGPGEFRKVRDISIGVDGDILVVDQANQRLTVVGRSGLLKREVSLRALGGSPEQILQVAPDDYVIWALSPHDPPVVQVDTGGQVIRRLAAPFAIASRIPFLGLQPQLGNDPASAGRWVYALIFADRWRVFDRLAPQPDDRAMIEPVPLPEVEFEDHGRLGFSSRMGVAYRAARSVAVVGDTVFVLYGGRTAEQGRWVDRYRLSTGAYMGSLLLPGVATEVAVSRGHLVVLEREDVPRIVLLRYRTAARDREQQGAWVLGTKRRKATSGTSSS